MRSNSTLVISDENPKLARLQSQEMAQQQQVSTLPQSLGPSVNLPQIGAQQQQHKSRNRNYDSEANVSPSNKLLSPRVPVGRLYKYSPAR